VPTVAIIRNIRFNIIPHIPPLRGVCNHAPMLLAVLLEGSRLTSDQS
jgi:hypothetical protein